MLQLCNVRTAEIDVGDSGVHMVVPDGPRVSNLRGSHLDERVELGAVASIDNLAPGGGGGRRNAQWK